MASTAQKYNTLNGTSVSNTTNTILFPSDLLTEGQNGAAMTLFINTIKNGTAKLNLAGSTSTAANATAPALTSAYGEIPIVQSKSGTLSSNAAFNAHSNTYVRSNQTITLPMPKGLDFASSANWSRVEFASTAGAVDQVTDMSKGKMALAGRLGLNTLSSIAESVGLKGSKELQEFGTKSVVNSYAETLFKSMNNRSFTFQWTLTPRNSAEATNLDNMLRMLRFHHLPEFDETIGNGNAYLLYPSSFDIVWWLNGAVNTYIPRISTCALTNIETNYTPGNGFVVMSDGSPQSYFLSLGFGELQVLNKAMVGTLDSSGSSF